MPTVYGKKLEKQERKVRVIYVSSYIPRKCGIATFTKDLTTAINALNPYNLAEIMAVNDNGYDYPWEVKFRINQQDLGNYHNAAEYINNSSAELVCLQHENGLFGGREGGYIVKFLQKIKKPIVTTLHTVPETPNSDQLKIIRDISKLSTAMVVMIDTIVERLTKTYGVNENKILVIPHGVPDLPFGSVDYFKKLLRLKNAYTMTSVNLLSENKGIEYALQSVPEVVKKIPNFIYLVIGVTHPVIKKHSNETYRHKLEELVNKLSIKGHVKFINRYLPLEELLAYLKATDIYITPYLDPGQVASGNLAYALGAGKACISTPYIYAQEVLDLDRGILVPFRNYQAISKAIVKLYSEPKFKQEIERKAYSFGREMTWPSVALQYLDLFRLVLQREKVRTH